MQPNGIPPTWPEGVNMAPVLTHGPLQGPNVGHLRKYQGAGSKKICGVTVILGYSPILVIRLGDVVRARWSESGARPAPGARLGGSAPFYPATSYYVIITYLFILMKSNAAIRGKMN